MDFNFFHSIVLESENVLKLLTVSDFKNLLEISINKRETWEYYLVHTISRENLEKTHLNCVKIQRKAKRIFLCSFR